MDHREARHQLHDLQSHLRAVTQSDQEQEVRGIAVPVLDAVIEPAKQFAPADHPVIATIRGVISPESVELGEPMRAVDVLLVVTALLNAIGYPETETVF